MTTKIFFLMSITFFLFSCNNGSDKTSGGGCDSLQIAEAIVKKAFSEDFAKDEKYGEIRSYYKSPLFKIFSGPLDVDKARLFHINYLKWSKAIPDPGGNIVHYLSVEPKDLQSLYDNGKYGGVRMYFCREGVSDSLSIILVPVDANKENVLSDQRGNTALVNKVEPCPDNCNSGNYASRNSKNDLNFEENNGHNRWYKPNAVNGTRNQYWNEDNSATVQKY